MLKHMDTKNLSHYQTLLEAQKEKLLREIASHSAKEDFGGDVDSEDEKTDAAEEEGNRLAIVESLKEDLGEVESALEKIRRGTYSVCERCGKTIEDAVLAAAPESAVCRTCKQAP
jgi:RNA polymerase-binding transcription factor DksA